MAELEKFSGSGDYVVSEELMRAEQIIRSTGLLDPNPYCQYKQHFKPSKLRTNFHCRLYSKFLL